MTAPLLTVRPPSLRVAREAPVWAPGQARAPLGLVSGRLGRPADWNYLKEKLEGRYGSRCQVLVSSRCKGFETQKGIHHNGDLLFSEIAPVLQRTSSLTKVSFIGHDTGGLTIRYCLRLLESETKVFERVRPEFLVTLGCPHLGHTRGNCARFQTGVQLLLADGAVGAPPLLLRMGSDPRYLTPLRRFRRRLAYANVHEAGNVEYPTAALRPDHPYQQVPDNQLESMCSPHYEKILLSTPAEATIHSAEQADYPEQSQDVINFKRYQNLWSGNAYASSDDARRVGEWLAMGAALRGAA
eukprot:CAMPEP_0194673718 /NCGR_PEP_ID=MMETSP0295-20121207/7222_1 /TAXON_ID=39354 /ORGANISM="Heterosigma akashiwo, Strain CCMP2393" /LENGTH=297 /DNA_ID=CAMNT_0039557701 /DNA_START=435 /DNA_END=1326 /DNA_ORIENTATION=-